jgi:hypothetical protein
VDGADYLTPLESFNIQKKEMVAEQLLLTTLALLAASFVRTDPIDSATVAALAPFLPNIDFFTQIENGFSPDYPGIESALPLSTKLMHVSVCDPRSI